MISSKLTISSVFLMFSSIYMLGFTGSVIFLLCVLIPKSFKDLIGFCIDYGLFLHSKRIKIAMYKTWSIISDSTFQNIDQPVNFAIDFLFRYLLPCFICVCCAVQFLLIPANILSVYELDFCYAIFGIVNIFNGWIEEWVSAPVHILLAVCLFNYSTVIFRKQLM